MLELADEWDLPILTNSYISVYSRPGCATTLPLDTCRPVPDEVAHAEVEALEHKYGKEYTSYATHVLQQLERGESPVPAEGIGLACRAGKSSAWINWQGVMTPCVDMETPAVSLLSTTVSDAWKQIVTKCEQLPFHKECAGCTLRSICDVCYANARNEKGQCGGIGYLCRIAKSKKKQMKGSL